MTDVTSLVKSRRTGSVAALAVTVLTLLILVLGVLGSPAPARAEDKNWDEVAAQIQGELETIPDLYAKSDSSGVQDAIRRAYYEHYQVSGLEQEIQHRLSDDLNKQFVSDLLAIRKLSQEPGKDSEVEAEVQQVVGELLANVNSLKDAPEVSDRWSRVATSITDLLAQAGKAYAAGDTDGAYNAARDAYLAHYEADGLEKATISYIGQSRVNALEAQYQNLRQWARDKSVSTDEYQAAVDTLSASVTEDGKEIDQMSGSGGELGWTGFFAAFLILIREGAEALLVVAAVITFAMKAGRRDQLVGILVGVVLAILISVGLAVLFSAIAASATTGLSQELLEGVTGFLAVIMLVWVAIWIHNKSDKEAWDKYIRRQAGEKVATGGVFALGSVAFLAVLREGSETILFFAPILAGARSAGDHAKIWVGVGAAFLVLAILFVLVWKFGVRLPLKQFFTVMAVLIALLAVTILGGAIKEFQDATLISAHAVGGVPTVSVLGLYPTVESLASQLILIVIFVAMWLVSRHRKNQTRAAATS